MQTPHRFRTKRQLWAYCGLALKTSTSGEYRIRAGPAETLQEVPGHSRAQRQPQSRSEKYLQGCGDPSRCRPWTVSGVLRRSSSQRDEANDGASHPGAQDRGHHFDRLEERSAFRRRTSKTTSSLSVCGEPPSLDSSRAMAGWFSRRSGSRVSIHNPVRLTVLRALSLSRNPMPPRTTRKSDRRQVSDRTMVGTAQPLCLFASGTERRRYDSTMNLRKRKTHSVSSHYWGWTARPSSLRLPVAGEAFVLTSPFIERGNRTSLTMSAPVKLFLSRLVRSLRRSGWGWFSVVDLFIDDHGSLVTCRSVFSPTQTSLRSKLRP